METVAKFLCAFCSEENVIEVDISAGMYQEYIEDCQVCCRPNRIKVYFDEETLTPHLEAEYEE
ncbi:MAG: CPXCG motif-containing cysteine-rich protein [candidate division KSB1 bacterium]|nr:CPXCG motif-containing cysteine-rich protein [candidate division KSB1 bacterium]